MGQDKDLVNPCALMVYMGAIANGGRAAEPYLILKTKNGLGIPSLPRWTHKTGTLLDRGTAEKLAELVPTLGLSAGSARTVDTPRLIDPATAETLAALLANNVTQSYGEGRFPNMDLCAKSGTAEVGEGLAPHAWFAGFLRNEDAPYAFVVLVENGGGGSSVAGNVAARVLDVMVNGYEK